jgi:hypothetical protein
MANNVTLAFPPAFCQQFFDRNGKPLSGGRLYTFVAGTRTSIVTYKTIGSTSSANRNTNPIVLDSAGYANLVLEVGKSYRFILTDRFGFVIKEWDNVTASSGDVTSGDVTKEYVDVQDGLLDGKIEAETAARAEADANLKDYVDSNVLRIAPPESAGDGEVIFYRGQLLQ